jgi:hypothetical protein
LIGRGWLHRGSMSLDRGTPEAGTGPETSRNEKMIEG